jgi:hypothetical protein
VTRSLVEPYLRLGLELGRHVEGVVDAYYGPPELAEAVDAGPPVDPRALVSAAERLLDELEDGWLAEQRGAARLDRLPGGGHERPLRQRYLAELPEGGPERCNPVIRPGCRSRTLERNRAARAG